MKPTPLYIAPFHLRGGPLQLAAVPLEGAAEAAQEPTRRAPTDQGLQLRLSGLGFRAFGLSGQGLCLRALGFRL